MQHEDHSVCKKRASQIPETCFLATQLNRQTQEDEKVVVGVNIYMDLADSTTAAALRMTLNDQ